MVSKSDAYASSGTLVSTTAWGECLPKNETLRRWIGLQSELIAAGKQQLLLCGLAVPAACG